MFTATENNFFYCVPSSKFPVLNLVVKTPYVISKTLINSIRDSDPS